MESIQQSFEDFLRYLEAVLPPDLATYEAGVIAATAVIGLLVLLVLLVCVFGRKRKGRHVCLLGLSDSGKTLLFMRLKYGHFMRTQNSIKENITQYEPSNKKGKPVELVDIPGDERVRDRLFSKYKNSLRAVVLVIDSVNFPEEVRSVSEMTFDLLSEKTMHTYKIPLLLACNKQDMALARRCSNIQKELEKEISALRVSRSAKPTALDGGPKRQTPVAFIGKKGKDFEFSDLPFRVSFVPCSARGRGEEDGSVAEIEEVTTWIDQLC